MPRTVAWLPSLLLLLLLLRGSWGCLGCCFAVVGGFVWRKDITEMPHTGKI